MPYVLEIVTLRISVSPFLCVFISFFPYLFLLSLFGCCLERASLVLILVLQTKRLIFKCIRRKMLCLMRVTGILHTQKSEAFQTAPLRKAWNCCKEVLCHSITAINICNVEIITGYDQWLRLPFTLGRNQQGKKIFCTINDDG